MQRAKKKKKSKKTLKDAVPIPLDSDLEDEKGEDEEEIGQEWGKKKDYYSADYVDEDYDGKTSCDLIFCCQVTKLSVTIDANESDAEVAELEEQEALAIQQRMAQQLEDADFGLDFITHLKVSLLNYINICIDLYLLLLFV